MKKIVSSKQAVLLSRNLRDQGKKLVLVGGCFDILHLGHIDFISNAKKYGDHLMVLLESDTSVKHLKGEQRPINQQKTRAKLLEALSAIDSIYLLPPLLTNKDYDALVLRVKPAIIATTVGDPFRKHKEKQAKSVDGRVISIKKTKDQSTTKLAKVLSEHFYL